MNLKYVIGISGILMLTVGGLIGGLSYHKVVNQQPSHSQVDTDIIQLSPVDKLIKMVNVDNKMVKDEKLTTLADAQLQVLLKKPDADHKDLSGRNTKQRLIDGKVKFTKALEVIILKISTAEKAFKKIDETGNLKKIRDDKYTNYGVVFKDNVWVLILTK